MSSVERFIRYIKIDTQSDPKHSDVVPSTQKQFDLAKVLYEELKEMGLSDVRLDEHCYVYGKLPSNLIILQNGSVLSRTWIPLRTTAEQMSIRALLKIMTAVTSNCAKVL